MEIICKIPKHYCAKRVEALLKKNRNGCFEKDTRNNFLFFRDEGVNWSGGYIYDVLPFKGKKRPGWENYREISWRKFYWEIKNWMCAKKKKEKKYS